MSQMELKFLPIASEAKARDQQDLMSFPIVSLSKNKRTTSMRFEDSKGNYIEVNPNAKYGMATIWDFDIMLYFIAYIRHRIDAGDKVTNKFVVSGYDILKFCGRDTGKSQYDQLQKALQRLKSTEISTNIRKETKEGDEIEQRNKYTQFSWITEFTNNTVTRTNSKTGRKKLVTQSYVVTLPQWIIAGVVDSKLVLGINPTYFSLTGGMQRWLYRIARKFAGLNPQGVRYTLRHMYERSGSQSSYRKFKQNIKLTIEKGGIPDYYFALYKVDGKDMLFFMKKEKRDRFPDAVQSVENRLQSFRMIAESCATKLE